MRILCVVGAVFFFVVVNGFFSGCEFTTTKKNMFHNHKKKTGFVRGCFYNQKKPSGMGAKLTAPRGLPGRSPTPVLTGPCAA